ncbi:MAG: hypothetical protein ACRETO_07745 [Gammaproteobacteria bacterium]
MTRASGILVRVAMSVALLALSACTSVETRHDAQQGNVYAQMAMYQDALHARRGGKPDLPQAEHWFAAIAQQDVQFRSIYANYLIFGRFGHIDEDAALKMARSAPQNDEIAQRTTVILTSLRQMVSDDFPYWQKLYAETRPLCPDRYPGADTPANGALKKSNSVFNFGLLPDSIQPGMKNLHAYIMLVRNCPFTLTEHLNDPRVYLAASDWYRTPVWSEKAFAGEMLSYAANRFPVDSKSMFNGAVADPKSIAEIRLYLLKKYNPLYYVGLDKSKKQFTADCYIAVANIKDQFQAKKFEDVVKAVDAAQQGACKGGYQQAFLEQSAIFSLMHMKAYAQAYTRGLNALQEDTLEGDVDTEIVHLLTETVAQLQAWQDADPIIAAIKSRSPNMKGLTF